MRVLTESRPKERRKVARRRTLWGSGSQFRHEHKRHYLKIPTSTSNLEASISLETGVLLHLSTTQGMSSTLTTHQNPLGSSENSDAQKN